MKLVSVLVFLLLMSFSACLYADGLADASADILKGRYASAKARLTPLARQGDVRAQLLLVRLHAIMRTPDDNARALYWAEQAALKGSSRGMLFAGILHYRGLGKAPDYPKAMRWFRKAAQKGRPEAFVYLGEMYLLGRGVERDYSRAVRLYRIAARAQHPHALFVLSLMYSTGEGVPRDRQKADAYLAAAARHGHRRARRLLAYRRLTRRIRILGVSKDPAYGYTPKKPIHTGYMAAGEHVYLAKLRGPNGERISYRRLGHCCPFRSSRAPFGHGLLDRYQVTYPGISRPVILYLDMYEPGPVMAPMGFTHR